MAISNYLLKDLPKFERGTIRVPKDDFFIPRISEYYLLFKNNYTLPQLKQICKHYKLPRSGVKKTLITVIYNYLFYSDAVVKIQKMVRGMMQRKLNKMRGPALLNRKLCVNDCDFFSLNELISIPMSQFYSFKDEDGFIYGFDILSLWQLFGQKKAAENPYNRKVFPEQTFGILRRLVSISKNMNQKIDVKLKNDKVSREKELELRIVNAFQFMDTLGNYTNHTWFMELDAGKLYRFCRELHDIWNHRAQISEETKQRISPNGNPFRTISIDSAMNIYEIRKNCVLVIENMLYDGITDDDKSLGAYYILAALTLQSQDAAAALPWLYQSVA
jgi:hypothetical protein